MNTQDEDNTENKVHMLKFLGNKMGFMMQEELTCAAHFQLQLKNDFLRIKTKIEITEEGMQLAIAIKTGELYD